MVVGVAPERVRSSADLREIGISLVLRAARVAGADRAHDAVGVSAWPNAVDGCQTL